MLVAAPPSSGHMPIRGRSLPRQGWRWRRRAEGPKACALQQRRPAGSRVRAAGRRRGLVVCNDGSTEMQRSTSGSSGATATIRKQTIQKGDLSQAPKLDDGDGGGFGNFDDGGDGGDDDGDDGWGWEEVPWKGSALGMLALSAIMFNYYQKEKAYRRAMGRGVVYTRYEKVEYDDDMDLSTIVSYSK